MDSLKLEALVLVAEEESFSAAADRAGTAQSTISSRIKQLEAALGQRLFLRAGRQVRLTPAGEAALPAARTALAALESIRQVVDDVAGIRRGRVRLGIVTGAEVPQLGGVLAGFAQEYPGIELVVTSESSADLEQAVSDGTMDIALVVRAFEGRTESTGLRWEGLPSSEATWRPRAGRPRSRPCAASASSSSMRGPAPAAPWRRPPVGPVFV